MSWQRRVGYDGKIQPLGKVLRNPKFNKRGLSVYEVCEYLDRGWPLKRVLKVAKQRRFRVNNKLMNLREIHRDEKLNHKKIPYLVLNSRLRKYSLKEALEMDYTPSRKKQVWEINEKRDNPVDDEVLKAMREGTNHDLFRAMEKRGS